jgi:hypothetical protein
VCACVCACVCVCVCVGMCVCVSQCVRLCVRLRVPTTLYELWRMIKGRSKCDNVMHERCSRSHSMQHERDNNNNPSVQYVAPPPFANSDVSVNNALITYPMRVEHVLPLIAQRAGRLVSRSTSVHHAFMLTHNVHTHLRVCKHTRHPRYHTCSVSLCGPFFTCVCDVHTHPGTR